MRLNSFVLASFLVAAVGFSGGDARAQAVPNLTFDSVSTYSIHGALLTITGVQHGASAASTVNLSNVTESTNGANNPGESCERQLLVAINRPGRFSVGVFTSGTLLVGCALAQLP